MTSPPWRRRRPARPSQKPDVSSDGGAVAARQRFPVSTASIGATEQTVRRRQVGLQPAKRVEESSTPVRRSHQASQAKRSGVAGLIVVGLLSVVTGVILFQRDSTSDQPSLIASGSTSVTVSTQDPTIGLPTSTTSPQVLESAVPQPLDLMIKSIVLIEADCPTGLWLGSGTIVLDGSYVLTNQHVAESADCEYLVCFTESWTKEPVCEAFGELVADDVENDLAVLRLMDQSGAVYRSNRPPVTISDTQVEINETIYLVGYPGVGGDTITSVSGVVSGLRIISPGTGDLQGEFIKTDARSGPGVSGGAAFNSAGVYIGTPTGGSVNLDEGTSLGLVRPARFAEALLDQVSRG